MGSQNTKDRKVDNTQLERLFPEPDYKVTTRTPISSVDWKTNIQRGVREDELKGEAYILAR